ncbi:MAG: DUF3488 domain-containing protein [Betaproteobacteria bacterium]|nr:DUF3488 domain-containing protein [Betaproteobacteria bacterium]
MKSLPLPNLLMLFAGLALAVSPHTGRLLWWVTGMALVCLMWRAYLAWRDLKLPNRWILFVFAIGSLAGVYFNFRTIFGRDPGVTLLVLLLALKLLELRTMRDVFVVTFLAYFIALTNFFYSQTIPTAVTMLVTLIVITAGLVGFNATSRPLRDNLRTAGLMLAQAGPLMLLLFFLFPRVQGPLWGLPQDAYSGITGLSDSMTPGAISSLSQSDAIAFRVKFDGPPPPPPQLYWRGPVFWQFDGRTWTPGDLRFRGQFRFETTSKPYDYEVTLEPHNRNWLFALEIAARLPPNSRVASDYVLLSLPPVRNRIRYEMRSYTEFRGLGGDEAADIRPALALPRGFNPRAVELGREWRRSIGEDHPAILRRAIEFFRAGQFEYTLSPPLLGEHTVDEFLFGTKQGFCEHFASSFVVLMRAAGIPARIVTGYQGGELNPVDQYMVVRQSDAHAWAEIWLADRGWIRVDPTAAAHPIRVEAGLAASMPASASLPLFVRADMDWLRSMRNNWEALGNRWNQWVLGYNPDRQREVLSRFGMSTPSWQNMAIALFWTVAGTLGLIALWLLRRIRFDDPVQRVWLAFCARLNRSGCPRDPAEGPLAFTGRVAQRFPDRAQAVAAIGELYAELRYGPRRGGAAAVKQEIAKLKSLVRQFNARRRDR